jgi:RNA polymerase sigma-70 factor (ECF subfamily)
MITPTEFDSLIRAIRTDLVRYATRLVGDSNAEDVVQLVLSKAVLALPEFRGEASPRTWLFRIATNTAHDWNRAYRGARIAPLESDQEESDFDFTKIDASQERQLVREEMSQCVGEVLRTLPENYQIILALSDCDELSDREVADILGTTLGATKIRLHRARTKLKEALEGTCSFYRDAENTLCCDRKEKVAERAYPLATDSRLQDSHRTGCGNTEQLKDESAMTTFETLPIKQRHLIGVGAAVAAGCEPCTQSYVAAAHAEGACERGVRFAIEHGLTGRNAATSAITAFVDQTFPKPELDAAFRAERRKLGALIEVATAVASNAASSLPQRISAARALGANDAELRIAVRIGQTTKQGAEKAMTTALKDVFGETFDNTPAPCCDKGVTDPMTPTDTAQSAERASGPCACGS